MMSTSYYLTRRYAFLREGLICKPEDDEDIKR